MNATPTNKTGDSARWNAVLWASAFVIGGLVLAQAGRLGAPQNARAEMVMQSGDYTMATADGGSEDILLVIDQKTEDMLVYRVHNQKDVKLRGKQNLREMFIGARAASGATGVAPVPPGGGR